MSLPRLTTSDNPYDPFKQWNLWYNYDVLQGYATCERIAAIAETSDDLSDEENLPEWNRALDVIISHGAYSKQGKKVEYLKVYEK